MSRPGARGGPKRLMTRPECRSLITRTPPASRKKVVSEMSTTSTDHTGFERNVCQKKVNIGSSSERWFVHRRCQGGGGAGAGASDRHRSRNLYSFAFSVLDCRDGDHRLAGAPGPQR